MNDDYIIRFERNGEIDRNFHDTLVNQRKEFNKMKKDSSIIWAELIQEPLDEEDAQYIIDSFRKDIIEILGKRVVINL